MLLRNITSSFSNIIMKRLICTTGIVNSTRNPRVPRKQHKNININLELLSSLFDSSIGQYLDVMHINVLSKFLKPVNEERNRYTFAIDETVAKDIVEKVLYKSDDVVIEGNPGLGLITINLIKAGISCFYVLENSFLQYLSLLEIILEHTRRISRQNLNMDQNSLKSILWSLDVAAKHSEFIWKCNSDVDESETFWRTQKKFFLDSTVKFLGICTSFYFLRSFVYFFRMYYSEIKNLELYLIITSKICRSIEIFSPKNLKYFQYCILNLFFNIQKLASYPRSAFLPPSIDNNENMNLVKITINSDFLRKFENSDIEEYFIFLTILGRKKSGFVISTLEKWLPNCGPYLISKGISVLNQAQDLSPQDSFALFKIFKQLDGYDDFRNCILHVFQHVR